MRKETILINERDLMFVVAGQLYDQAPNRQPRKADEIMLAMRDNFRNDARCNNDNEFYSIRVETDKVYDFLKSMLFSISAFHELNLSQIEFDNGVSVDDETRGEFAITTRYDVHDPETWKRDFIDLDAFVRNVCNRLYTILDADCDCFLCANQPINPDSALSCGESEKCKECVANPNLKNNYEGRRFPKGEYTFSCKYDCPKNRYICCEQCGDAEICNCRCDAESKDCGLAICRKEEHRGKK